MMSGQHFGESSCGSFGFSLCTLIAFLLSLALFAASESDDTPNLDLVLVYFSYLYFIAKQLCRFLFFDCNIFYLRFMYPLLLSCIHLVSH